MLKIQINNTYFLAPINVPQGKVLYYYMFHFCVFKKEISYVISELRIRNSEFFISNLKSNLSVDRYSFLTYIFFH